MRIDAVRRKLCHLDPYRHNLNNPWRPTHLILFRVNEQTFHCEVMELWGFATDSVYSFDA